MKPNIFMILIFLVVSISCEAQTIEITFGWDWTRTPEDSIRVFELDEFIDVPIDTLFTVSAIESTRTIQIPVKNRKQRYAAKGYVIQYNVWTPYSNTADSVVIGPPGFWIKKK